MHTKLKNLSVKIIVKAKTFVCLSKIYIFYQINHIKLLQKSFKLNSVFYSLNF